MIARLTAAVLFVASLASAQEAPKPPSGRISGRVVAMDTSKPLRHALVWMVSQQGRQSATRTDAQGRYEFTGLAAGTYRLDARADRYLRMNFGGQPYSGLAAAVPKGVTLRDGEQFDKADFSLPRGAAIEVKLLDEFGDPAPGLQVQLSQVEFAGGRRRLMPRGGPGTATRTDDRGFIRVHGLSPGTYYISALSGAFAEQAETGGFAPTYYPGTSDLAAATPVRLDLGQELTVSFQLAPARMARIGGRVVDSAGAPARASVMLSSADAAGLSEFFVTRGESDAEGAFVFRNVPPGRFTLQAYGAQVVAGAGNLGASQFGWLPLVVDGTDQPDLTVRVAVGPSLKGRVASDDTTGATLNPRDVSVTALPVQFDSAPVGGGPPPFTMQDDGTFEVKNLSGQRVIRVSVRNPAWMLKRITRAGREITDEVVDFTKGNVDGVEVFLTNRVTSIAGRVTDDKANPVSDYSVLVFAADRGKWTDRSRFIALGRPSQDGTFKISGLPPEDYFAIALSAVPGTQWQDPEFLRTLEESATRFVLGDGEAKTVTLRLLR
jgi:hypothetical protein